MLFRTVRMRPLRRQIADDHLEERVPEGQAGVEIWVAGELRAIAAMSESAQVEVLFCREPFEKVEREIERMVLLGHQLVLTHEGVAA